MSVRLFLTGLPVILFLGVGGALFATSTKERQGSGTGYLDRPLPAFDRPALRGGQTGLTHADLAGQVSLIHVFASWCNACRTEHPALMQLAETSPVPIYGLNWRDRTGAALLFLERLGDPYTAAAADAQGTLGNQLGVTGVPETLVVDAGGRIRYRHIGPLSETVWDTVLLPLLQDLEAAS